MFVDSQFQPRALFLLFMTIYGRRDFEYPPNKLTSWTRVTERQLASNLRYLSRDKKAGRQSFFNLRGSIKFMMEEQTGWLVLWIN